MNPQRSLRLWRLLIFCSALALLPGLSVPQEGMTRPQDQMIIAVDFSSAPTFFDPAATSAMGMPCFFPRARHGTLVQPLRAHALTPGSAVADALHAAVAKVHRTPLTDFPTPSEERRLQKSWSFSQQGEEDG